MFRCSAAARRLLSAPCQRIAVAAPRKPACLRRAQQQAHAYSTNSHPDGDGPGFSRQSRYIALAVVGGAVVWYASRKRRVTVAERHQERTRRDNLLPDVSGADVDEPLESPTKVVEWPEVDSLIRKGATSFKFDGHKGKQGRIDTVRFESNSPTEDEWAVGVGAGVGGGTTIFAGVYDGHA